MDSVVCIAGSAHPSLAEAVGEILGVRLGRCVVERFPDGEVGVRLGEDVGGRDIVVVQPTSPPVNDHLIELLAIADACLRSGATRILVAAPYYGYGRGDDRHGRREPIMARLTADLLQDAGVDWIAVVDPHSPQLEGFFRIPFRSLTASSLLADALEDRVPYDAVVVSPDLGRVEAAVGYGQRFGLPVAVVHKQRVSGEEVESTSIIGDVRGRPCLIIDDMISTGGTIVACTRALLRAGAEPRFWVAATHGLWVGRAVESLQEAGIERVWVTDTVPQPTDRWTEIEVVPVAPIIASALREAL